MATVAITVRLHQLHIKLTMFLIMRKKLNYSPERGWVSSRWDILEDSEARVVKCESVLSAYSCVSDPLG